MMRQQVKYYTEFLQRENYKSFYLAFLRVIISLWLLKEIAIKWESLDLLYGPSCFQVLKENSIAKYFPGGFSFIHAHYLFIFIIYIVLIVFNIVGIGRWITALLLFLMTDLVQKMNMPIVNGGDMLARLILLYLIFADSYQYFVMFKSRQVSVSRKRTMNLLSNLSALSVMIQLCLIYFASGLAKLNTNLWWHGEATYYALSIERFMGTRYNKLLIQNKWFDIFTGYSVLVFEILFPFLIWIKKLRKLLLVSGFLFHAVIYVFLMIFGMEVVFVLVYGLFLPNRQWLNFASRIKLIKRGNSKLILTAH